jgi:hypothetical protein
MRRWRLCVYFKANFFVDPQDQTKWFEDTVYLTC